MAKSFQPLIPPFQIPPLKAHPYTSHGLSLHLQRSPFRLLGHSRPSQDLILRWTAHRKPDSSTNSPTIEEFYSLVVQMRYVKPTTASYAPRRQLGIIVTLAKSLNMSSDTTMLLQLLPYVDTGVFADERVMVARSRVL